MAFSSTVLCDPSNSSFSGFAANFRSDEQQYSSPGLNSSNNTGQEFSCYLQNKENRNGGSNSDQDHGSSSNRNNEDNPLDRKNSDKQGEGDKTPENRGIRKSKKVSSKEETLVRMECKEAAGLSVASTPIHPGPLSTSISGLQKTLPPAGIGETRLQEIPGLTALRCGNTDKGLPSVMMELENRDAVKTIIRLDLTPGGNMALTVTSTKSDHCGDLGNVLIKALRQAGMEVESSEGQEAPGGNKGESGSKGEREGNPGGNQQRFHNPLPPSPMGLADTKTVPKLSRGLINMARELKENYFPYSDKPAIIPLHETGYFSTWPSSSTGSGRDGLSKAHTKA